jgi:hypothetical protein
MGVVLRGMCAGVQTADRRDDRFGAGLIYRPLNFVNAEARKRPLTCDFLRTVTGYRIRKDVAER